MKKYLLILLCCPQMLTAKVFQGVIPGNGEIPDGQVGCGNLDNAGDPLEITFDVSGISFVSNVELQMEINHSWVGDLVVILSSPDETGHTIFGGIPSGEEDSCRDSSNLQGLYRFTDFDSGGVDGENFFEHAQAFGTNEIIPTGRHRTLSLGIFDDPVVTSIDDTFEGNNDPNGTWTLTIYDLSAIDTGSVTDAKLFINGAQGGSITEGIAEFKVNSRGQATGFHNSVQSVLHPNGNRYFYRTGNDSKEYYFPTPDEITYDGDVAVLSWFNVDGKGFDAQLTQNIDQTSESLKQAVLFSNMKITNNSNSGLNINLFNYADFDIFPIGDNVGFSVDVNYIKLFSNTDDYQMFQDYAQFRAGGLVGYHINSFVNVISELTDNAMTTLPNGIAEYGPDDLATAFQMSTLFPIASGASHEFKMTMAIGGATAPDPNDPNAIPNDDLIFKDGWQ